MEQRAEVKVKICGLRRPEDIETANRLRPDYIGFVFADTRRKVEKETAERLRELLADEIPAVGVFVNAPAEQILDLYREGIIQMAQLHGDEGTGYIERLRSAEPEIPLIKAVRVRSEKQILEAEKLDCRYLLLDTFVKDAYGGTGEQFDKSLVPRLSKPFFLAGGLDAENVKENIIACNPFAVDVSSAVETDGMKDEAKIKEFLERVRSYE